MGFDLAALARPMTRAQALKSGALVDTTACAAFLGFRFPAALSAAAWDEVVGTPGIAATRQERADATDRLRQVWVDAARALSAKLGANSSATSVTFMAKHARGRKVALVLVCSINGGQPVLAMYLQGEL